MADEVYLQLFDSKKAITAGNTGVGFSLTAPTIGLPCLGACPRIGILFKIDEFSENKHNHIIDIEVYAICEHYFLKILKRLGKRAFSDSLLVECVVEHMRFCFPLRIWPFSGVSQAFKIPSGSMVNTLVIGDRLFVNKFIYGIKVPFTDVRLPGLRKPKRGDVVVFRYPRDRTQDFIKRLVGVPGDIIDIRDKKVYVNGTVYQDAHELHKDAKLLPRELSVRDNFGSILVPAKSYFVMGDNRDNSLDSRFWGFVPEEDMIGLAFIKFWSWDRDKWRPRWKRIGRLIN